MKGRKRVGFAIILTATLAMSGCGKGLNTEDMISTSEISGDETGLNETEDRDDNCVSGAGDKESAAGHTQSESGTNGVAGMDRDDSKDRTEGKSEDASNENSSQGDGNFGDGSDKDGGKEKDNKNGADGKSGSGTKNSQTGDTGKKDPSDNVSTEKVPQTGQQDNSDGGTTVAHTTCSWDGGRIVREPDCVSEGQRVYTCTVCGNERTESVPAAGHQYVTEKTDPTCTEPGSIKTYCSVCGNVESEEQGPAATGHSMTVQWFGEPPTCTRGGYQTPVCSICGWVDADACGDVPPLGHECVGKEVQHGNCRDYTIIEYSCIRCGELVEVDRHNEPDEHSWVWKEDSIWDDELGEFVTIKVECCERCNARP